MTYIEWSVTPIPDKGSVFPFKTIIKKDKLDKLLEANNLVSDRVVDVDNEEVFLISNANSNDHVATYVPSSLTLYTGTREAFRNDSRMIMKEDNFANKIRVDEMITMFENWKKEADVAKGRRIPLDSWAISMLISKMKDIKGDL